MKKAKAFYMGTRGGGSKQAAQRQKTNQKTFTYTIVATLYV